MTMASTLFIGGQWHGRVELIDNSVRRFDVPVGTYDRVDLFDDRDCSLKSKDSYCRQSVVNGRDVMTIMAVDGMRFTGERADQVVAEIHKLGRRDLRIPLLWRGTIGSPHCH